MGSDVMKKITKTIKETVYIASDGKEFDNEEDCNWYEKEIEKEKEEKEIEQDLGIGTHANYPGLLNYYRTNYEYKLFLIKNEADLDRFVKVFDWYFYELEKYPEVQKDTFAYPEVLMILDTLAGGDDTRLYKVSQLGRQFNAFADEVNYIINLIVGEDDENQNTK